MEEVLATVACRDETKSLVRQPFDGALHCRPVEISSKTDPARAFSPLVSRRLRRHPRCEESSARPTLVARSPQLSQRAQRAVCIHAAIERLEVRRAPQTRSRSCLLDVSPWIL